MWSLPCAFTCCTSTEKKAPINAVEIKKVKPSSSKRKSDPEKDAKSALEKADKEKDAKSDKEEPKSKKEKGPKSDKKDSQPEQEKEPKSDDEEEKGGRCPHQQRANLHRKDERDFVANRELISRVLARLEGHEREKRTTEIINTETEAKVAKCNAENDLVLTFPLTFDDAEMLRGHFCKFGGELVIEPCNVRRTHRSIHCAFP